ncbi:MAG: Na-translocating system protein MpsC family protein [Solirubrobacteraceae bacterium]|nr:Na-translocating system protein MpsC family protein [Solirubrobacteraceae bacterium]
MELLRADIPVAEQPSEITRFVVRTFAKSLGRGPTRARAYPTGDVICVLLQETLTRPERLLLEHGQLTELCAMRAAIQRAMRTTLASGIEFATGRRVVSLHIDHQVEADIVALTFVLEASAD